MSLVGMINDEMLAELIGFSIAEIIAFLQSLGFENYEIDEDGDVEVYGSFGEDWIFCFDEFGSFTDVQDMTYYD
jgi:hypothetical protein